MGIFVIMLGLTETAIGFRQLQITRRREEVDWYPWWRGDSERAATVYGISLVVVGIGLLLWGVVQLVQAITS